MGGVIADQLIRKHYRIAVWQRRPEKTVDVLVDINVLLVVELTAANL